MTTMNDAEREAFEHCWAVRSADDEGNLGAKPLRSEADQQRYRGSAAQGSWVWFQRGAAWQRAQVAVPDVSAMAKVLSDRAADACCVDPDDNWKIYGQEYIEDVRAMLAAAPAHPAERQEQGEVQRLREALERATKLLSAAAGYATKMEPMPAKLLNAIDTALAACPGQEVEK